MTKIKLRYVMLILIIHISFNLYSKPGGEGVIVKDANNKAIMNISSANNFGTIQYKIERLDTNSEDAYVVFKVGNTYYSGGGKPFTGEEHVNLDKIFGEIQLGEESNIKFDSNSGVVKVGNAPIDFSQIGEARVDGETTVNLSTRLDEIELKVWTISKTKEVLEISTKVTPNFFPEESTFFNKLFGSSNLSDINKMIFFMSTFFIEEVKDSKGNVISIMESSSRSKFINIACKAISGADASKIPSISSLITTSNFETIYPELIKHQNSFKAAFVSHFKINNSKVINKDSANGREVILPFLDIKKESFDLIYGLGSTTSTHRNPYITAYLTYISTESENKSSKPVLSHIINKWLNDGNQKEIKYDYNQYRQITESEGISLARAALRYMTWGVEYTPKNISTLKTNKADNLVYKDNYQLLKSWVDPVDLNKNLRSSNYYSGPISIIPIPSYFTDPNSEFSSADKINYNFAKLYNKNLITSPFDKNTGNPIPYSPMGIDTPKTFNYKMLKQNEAREWFIGRHLEDIKIRDSFPPDDGGILNTTLAQNSIGQNSVRYQDSYIDEVDLYNEAGFKINNYSVHGELLTLPKLDDIFYKISPFNPGFKAPNAKGYIESENSIYHPNKSAGVDSLGLLMGAISMSEIDGDFLNVFNTKVNQKLDSYNRGNPEYHVNSNNDILNKPYRFTKSDFEKSSILLPDIKMARPGDILVNYSKYKPHIGIIVSADFTGLTNSSEVEDYMERIIVVSIKSGYRMANVGLWKNKKNVFSGFTMPGNEKSYHLRRLVTLPSDNNKLNSYVKDNFEMFDIKLLNYDIDLTLPTINSKITHWVPNTGELYRFSSIKIKGNYSYGALPLKDEDRNVTILPPIDQYYFQQTDQQAAQDESNIYRNKGSGFKFYATSGTDAICLATIQLRNSGTNTNDYESPYEVIYSADIFKASNDGRTKDGFKLVVEGDKLKFKILSGKNRQPGEYSSFAIRPLQDGIRPGDDLLLRFGKQGDDFLTGVAKEEDFIAVYDKKMLWRANLYINETVDWNDLNRWNAPPTLSEANMSSGIYELGDEIVQRYIKVNGDIDYYTNSVDNGQSSFTGEMVWYGPNEWNKSMNNITDAGKYNTTSSRAGFSMTWEDLSNLKNSNGGQSISFPSAIYYRTENFSSLVEGCVVYSYARTTTPFEYYYHMKEQYNAMEAKALQVTNDYNTALTNFLNDPIIYEEEYNNALEAYNDNIYVDINNKTLLPPDADSLLERWKNYDKDSYKPGSRDLLDWYPSPKAPFTQPSGTTNKFNKTYKNLEAGVDCGGLIYMSEAYLDTPYIRNGNGNKPSAVDAVRWDYNNGWSIHDCGPDTQNPGYAVNNNLFKILDTSDFALNIKPNNIKRVVPGDIIYYHGYHVMMVRDINIVNGNREIDLADIKIIESTYGDNVETGPIYGVGNTRNLNTYKDKTWYLGRIKTR